MDLNYFMNEAIIEANKALLCGEVPVGAVVVYDGKIIGRGHNVVETSKHAVKHAEIMAIMQAEDYLNDWRLDGAYLFTTLEPCIMCAGAIIHSRIKTLVYGAKDTQRGFAGSILNIVDDSIFNHRVEVISGIKEIECSKIINDFFRSRRKSTNKR
ncbi:nucleoside deaminase [Helcococcus kunzii]|uniref:tRNA adenosine(34) deaminase TadA n=1 Tax=Helcococcus kunzii TaxID=40091 RepID=UPI001C948AAD|nr:tRNA adenosine(34) deaminase TadA [Helcococcus kunzii]MCT1796164.1 tRNA adenosine(34) deaminase TadA [Helcococcus kunzii]MCT1989223.1 tRNA adenosine(34) deaminase TadA [Helcococcus kunzii]QZO76763.1 nucleoside deaminase [Helcococcus kunzii]